MVPSPSPRNLEVRNRTGVPQLYSAEGVSLEPGVWTPVPRLLAYRLHRLREADIRLPASETYVGMPRFYWLSPFSMGDGYATGAEHLLHAVIRAGAKPFVQSCWFCVDEELLPATRELLGTPPDVDGLYTLGFCMATPGEFVKLPTPYKIGLTMYEATNPLANHPEWRHQCNAVDRLFVPSQWCKELFATFVEKPIEVIPLAINPMYCIGDRAERKPKRTFTFFQYASLTGRKAPLELLATFQKAFPRDRYPDVRMVFKTRLGIFGWDENMLPAIDDSRISIINDNWVPERLFEFLRDEVDCMVFPSRGEGFGLPPRETMAMGIPTILTNGTGMVEVCDARYNWPIGVTQTLESPLGGQWDDPDWKQVADSMHEIADNPTAAFAKAHEGAAWFIREFGPDRAGKILFDRLSVLSTETPESLLTRLPTPLTLTDLGKFEIVHRPFLELLQHTASSGARVVLFGTEEGGLLAWLLRKGYDAWAVTDNLEYFEVSRETLRALRLDPARVSYVKSLIDFSGFGGPYAQADLVTTFSIMEHYSDKEVRRLVENSLKIAPTVLFSVPTVYSAKPRFGDERLLRVGQWRDILRWFEVDKAAYYDDQAHLALRVVGTAHGRGIVARNFGYTREGVWRPLYEKGKGITLHDSKE